MVTRELVKAEIDKVQDKNLDVIYRIIRAIESPAEPAIDETEAATLSWQQFINTTSGSLADDPLERGEFGRIENLKTEDWEREQR